MGEVLANGVYLPDRGERNAYDGLKGNWNTLDSIAGKVTGYDTHIADTDIHVTASDKQTWNGKADANHVHNADDVTTGVFDTARIPNLDASKITTGTIDIDRLPQGALERLVKVADQAARYALTTSDVQLGDTVQQLDTGVMYVVTDVTKLDSADGYTEYTAGSATSVPWSGVTGKPADYTPASHSHGNITNDGKVGTTANLPLITGTGGVVQAGSFGNQANTFCEGNDSRLSDARTPVAHTHVTADVTDLLNSAHTWSGDNTYSKTITVERNTDTGNFLALRNSVAELGSTPASATPVTIAFRDKNDENLGYMGVYYDTDGSNHFRLYVRNKFTSGAPSTSGTADYAYFGLKLNADKSKEGILRASLRPYDSNTYDLGSSSYQWNNLYANNYYYNGTAWGLDKNNVWTATQWLQGSNLVCKNSLKEIGSANSGGHFTINFYDKNEDLMGWVQHLTEFVRIGCKNKFTANGVLDPNGTEIQNYLSVYVKSDGKTSVGFVSDALPEINNCYNLGNDSYKWKTLNGVNPGALSLPNLSSGTGVSLSAGANSYSPPSDGWLSINLTGAISVVSGNFCHSGNDMLSVPVVKGNTYTVTVTTAGTAYLFTALGNV